MRIRWSTAALAQCLVLQALALPVVAQATPRPNIVLVVADDMGYGDLGCYGSKQVPTPHLDSLAASGVRFAQAYVSASVCAPSRAGLLTGRYQNRFGFEHNLVSAGSAYRDESIGIPRDEKTIGDRLEAAGYRTACIGKWHVGDNQPWHHPRARGFDLFFGMLKGHHTYFPKPEENRLWRNRTRVREIEAPYLTDWFTDEALRFIDAAPAGEPWFVYLAYSTPHLPLEAKAEDLEAFAHVADPKRRTYCAMQRCLDRNVGRLVQHLEQQGLRDNTLLVFLNDNGGNCDTNAAINAPLRGQKSTLLEGGVRVPLLCSWPAVLPRDTVYEQPVISLDLMPTLLAAAGTTLEPERLGPGRNASRRIYDGVDLLPYLRGERGDERPHATLYWRAALRGAAIRDGDWKLLRLPHRPPELYDLATDVSELRNVASDHPDRVAALMRKLGNWEASFERAPMWLGSNRWLRQNRALYDREYTLVQPR